jgi:hypothetical protein
MTHPTDPPTLPNDAIDTVRGDVREVRMGPSASSGSGLRNAIIVVVAIVAVALAWLFWKQLFAPVAKPVAQVPAEPPKVAVAPPAAEPEVRHPIEAPPGVPAVPLPALGESDRAAAEALSSAIGADALARYVLPQDLVRRIVATVDNLPRKTYAQRLSPVKPTVGSFGVAGREGAKTMAADNAKRYAAQVRAFELVDAKALVAAYVRLYPLFQEAYRELGYPKGHFNDRLVEVLDLMIATREPSGPIALAQPKVLYEFADPELEALPAGQKVMLRMGPENAARVKAKLREIRALVARDGAAAKGAGAAAK